MGDLPYVVVGAGYQGLTFALEAAVRGLRVIVVEKQSLVGGMAYSFLHDGFTCDLGMHGFISQDGYLNDLLKQLLGANYSRFRARPASWLGPGRLVEDRQFFPGHGQYPFFVDRGARRRETQVWNCMRVYDPPMIVYPKKGGFGEVFERMAAEITRRGGTILFDTAVSPSDMEVSDGTLRSMRIRGRKTPVAGCYWAAGDVCGSRGSACPDSLVLYHFFLKGRTPSPYHWVRIGVDNPLLPPIIYYPSNFSEANAPKGRYSVGAGVPRYRATERCAGTKRTIVDWFAESPADFQPWLVRFLSKAGFFPEADLLDVRQDVIPLPKDRFARRRFRGQNGLRVVRARNLLEADDWLEEIPGESWMPLMMLSALRAADASLPGKPAKKRWQRSEAPASA